MSKQKRKSKRIPNWAKTPMSPEAQAFYENTFMPQYKELLKRINQTPLTILVWGPGPNGGDIYEKRLQIRAELRALGLAALFSEEVSASDLSLDLSAKVNELCQALAADFIIVIQSSPGSIAEVHDFAGLIEAIGRKMIVFIDERFQGGYSYVGALQELRIMYNSVETYKYPQDIVECHLMQAVRKKVRILQAAKWRASIR